MVLISSKFSKLMLEERQHSIEPDHTSLRVGGAPQVYLTGKVLTKHSLPPAPYNTNPDMPRNNIDANAASTSL